MTSLDAGRARLVWFTYPNSEVVLRCFPTSLGGRVTSIYSKFANPKFNTGFSIEALHMLPSSGRAFFV
ncbi:hypothetical protein L6164_019650 [Bauhinia variegata]|uniref:Uncharacterized protein n=1 Tax=Bauhinia variegata TaxID=167791 RepID=A0ACB9MUG4_BAUVA|nr:hypothetical protein L6164_019650 [Bauhinia variegata]